MRTTQSKQQRGVGQRIAVVYARVSSEEQEKEGFSIPAQARLLREYASKEGLKVVDEFIDSETAKEPGRRNFQRMVKFLGDERQKGVADHCRIVLVEKTDRLYRNLKDYLTLDDLDLEIHFVKEGTIISSESHSSDKFMHGIKVLMAKQYIDNLSEEVKKGLQEKANQGQPPGRIPFGYRPTSGADGKRHIEPDPIKSKVLRRLFEQYATGKYSLAELGDLMRGEGHFADREGKQLVTLLHWILSNPVYYGQFRFRGQLYQGTYTPLITKELWDRVQRALRDRGRRKPRRGTHEFAFSHLVQCGHCGCAMVGEIKKGKYIYYHCTHYKGKCPEPYVREEVIDEHFAAILRRLRFDDEFLASLTRGLRESHADVKKFHGEAVEQLHREYKRLQDRIDRMYIDKLDGKIDAMFFDQKATEWRGNQADIRRQLAEHEAASQAYFEEGILLLELAHKAANAAAKRPPHAKRQILDFLLSNSTWADGVLTPVFRQPFDLIADAVAATSKVAAARPPNGGRHPEKLGDQDSNLNKQNQNLRKASFTEIHRHALTCINTLRLLCFLRIRAYDTVVGDSPGFTKKAIPALSRNGGSHGRSTRDQVHQDRHRRAAHPGARTRRILRRVSANGLATARDQYGSQGLVLVSSRQRPLVVLEDRRLYRQDTRSGQGQGS